MAQILDPLISLAFSIRANPGVYAILLGSGVSRSAGIPTGWEVVLDLVRQVAASKSESPTEHPERWYAEKYGNEPSYSAILNALCRTPIERQQLLKKYFEPTVDEREQGIKLPTRAHHAVAELMDAGLIRVVITTNFDRLLEQALEQRGIVPVVIGRADQAAGMIPLTHQKHCIIKVHGDYLDTRILNTEAELATYDPAITGLIDRVFDEFGLLVCGWSAIWDTALRASIERSPNRRYACYWPSIGALSVEAQSVVASKSAQVIAIESADNFFDSLLTHVRGLEEFERPHPLSVQAAVGAAKRYLADDSQRIRLHDLYRDALSEAKAIWTGRAFPLVNTPAPNSDTITQRIKAYDAAAATVVALTAAIGRWSRGEHDSLLVDAVGEIGKEPIIGGSRWEDWARLQAYPMALILYVGGMVSIVANRPELFSKLMMVPTPEINDRDALAVSRLFHARPTTKEVLSGLFGGVRRHVPMSDWLHDILRETFRDYVADDEYYDLLFDTFEFYFSLAYAALVEDMFGRVPLGAWAAHRHKNHSAIVAGLNGAAIRFGGQEFARSCEAFKRNGKSLSENLAKVEAFRIQVPFY